MGSPKNKNWKDLVNAESEKGMWDFFNIDGKLTLAKFKCDEVEFSIDMTEEEWVDLINLIKRISVVCAQKK